MLWWWLTAVRAQASFCWPKSFMAWRLGLCLVWLALGHDVQDGHGRRGGEGGVEVEPIQSVEICELVVSCSSCVVHVEFTGNSSQVSEWWDCMNVKYWRCAALHPCLRWTGRQTNQEHPEITSHSREGMRKHVKMCGLDTSHRWNHWSPFGRYTFQ